MSIDLSNIDTLPSGAKRVRVQHQGDVLVGTAPTIELAVQLRDELKRQLIDGDLRPTKGQTAKLLGPLFLGSRLGNRDTTNDSSRWYRHLATASWATRAISTVSRSDGASWLKVLKRKRVGFDLEKHGDREMTKISWQTRKHCLNLARKFFDWAIDEEIYGITANPFAGLRVEREDGDEDGGFQDTWYLDIAEQPRFLATWDDPKLDLDATDRMEKLIAQFAMGSGLRKGESWCLHLADVHLDCDGPYVEVKYGSFKKGRYRPPKGRKGEKKSRIVYLFGIALEAAIAWKKQLHIYAPKNPLGLMFPTERGARRTGLPRSWKKVVDAYGIVPRIGAKVWWHLLRHTCASSMVSGWWGFLWAIVVIQKQLGHTDVRTTQMYAHLAPSAVQDTAIRAQAAYLEGRHAAVTPPRRGERKSANRKGYARSDSNRRHSASKARKFAEFAEKLGDRDDRVTTFRHVLSLIADGDLSAPASVVKWLGDALDWALEEHVEEAAC